MTLHTYMTWGESTRGTAQLSSAQNAKPWGKKALFISYIFEVVCYVDKDRPKIYSRSGLQPMWVVYISFYYFSLLFQFPELLLSIYWMGKSIPPPAHEIDHDTKRDHAYQLSHPGLEYRTGSQQSFLCLSHFTRIFLPFSNMMVAK